MDIAGINAKIQEAKRQRKNLNTEKAKKEKEVKTGEGLFDDITVFRKNSANALNDFESKLNSRCENMPGNFGNYYKRQIQSALKETKAYEADEMVGNILKAIKNKIFDLDGVIEGLKNKIEGLNSLLRQLGDMLEDAKEAVEDAFTGGDK
ncbi:MAG: hypothetical protein IKT55_05135 [Clostridia bacterium]|nr:hypothetical protein [Clostridia bacterium]